MRRVKKLRWEAALVGVVALATTLAATERTPLTWDEGDAFVRAERVAAWTRAVVVGPEKLRETLKASDAKSESKADFNASDEKMGGGEGGRGGSTRDDGEKRGGATRDGAPEKSTQTPPINADDGEKEASERRERPARSRFGEVERAALEYFARFDGRRALFSEKAIEAGWPHVVYREGHPAGYSIAIALGRAFSLRFLPFLSEKAAFRFGPIALFAAALAAVFYRVGRNWGRFAAILSVVGIATIPRAFGHAQLAGGDSLLISSWLLVWAFFDAALASKRGAILLGGAVGVSFCAKFSGFAVVAPLTAGAVAALWARRRDKTRVWRKTDEVDVGEKEEKGKSVSETRRDGVGTTFGRLAIAGAVAAAVFFAANPPLWARPFAGFETFVSLNLRRDEFDIPIYFLGKFYSPSRPLPWWNGFFWLATTVPTALLAFAALGSVAAASRKKRRNNAIGGFGEFGEINGIAVNVENATVAKKTSEGDENVDEAGAFGSGSNCDPDSRFSVDGGRRGRRLAGLALAFAATLPLIRVIPGIPTHDGARLIIASFPFVAILAAFGATVFVDLGARLGEKTGRDGRDGRDGRNGGERTNERNERGTAARRAAQVVVASAFAIGVVDLVRSAPQYLSFYNATLGGVVGATRRGMEATYYWDAFDADAVAWLNEEIAAARADGRPSGVLFGSFSSQTLDYYRRWGTLATPEIETLSTPNALAKRARFGFYVVQRRPSGWTALELALFKTARPIYRKTVRNPLAFPANAGRRAVVLLEIYDFRDVERILTGGVGEETARSQRENEKSTAR